MKVVILCGGLGSRLAEETRLIPKPMVKVGRLPILQHIINYYKYYGFEQFLLATGYKDHVIQRYFKKKKKYKMYFYGGKNINRRTSVKIKKIF